MAVYEVTAPDGSVYEVEGPEGATPGQVQSALFANLAETMSPTDLSVARSKNDDFGAYLRDRALASVEGESEEERAVRLGGQITSPEVGTGTGIARDVFQGMTFGFGDEIVAGLAAAFDPEGRPWQEAYDAYLAAERGRRERFREESPVASYAAEIGGALPTALALPVGAAGQAASLPARIGAGAAAGAGTGAVYGFGAGEGGPVERAQSAGVGGLVGGAVGAAAPAAGAAVRNLAARRAANRAAADVGVTRPAYEALRRGMAADEALTGQGAANIQAAGPRAMVADAGPTSQAMLDTAIQASGPAARRARTAVEGRAAEAGRQITSALDDAFGAPAGGIRGTAQDIARRTADARQAAYDAAYSLPIDYAAPAGRRIEGVLARVPNRIKGAAVRRANEMMQADDLANQQIIARVADDGTVTFGEMPNVQQLDYIKRALGDMGAESVDNFGRPTGEGRIYSRLASQLRDAVSQSVPEYGQAVRLGGDKIAEDRALRLGYDMLKTQTPREAVREGFSDLSDEARLAAFRGVRDYIDDILARTQEAVSNPNLEAQEALKGYKMLSSRASRQKLTDLLGEDAAAALFGELEQAGKALQLKAAVVRGSQTAARRIMDETIGEYVEGGVMGALRSGDPVRSAQNLAASALGRAANSRIQVRDQVYDEIARFLTETRGSDAVRAIRELERTAPLIDAGADAAARAAERLARRNVAVTGPGTDVFR